MTGAGPAIPRSVFVLTGTLAGVAAALAALAGWHPLDVDAWVLLPLAATLVAGGMIQLDIHLRTEKNALDLFEAAIVPVILVFPGPGAVVLVAVTKLISQLLVGVRGVKVAFNVAQWSVAAAAASVVFLELRSTVVAETGALVIALVVAVSLNHLAVAGVLSLVQRRRYLAVVHDMSSGVASGMALTDTINASFGLLFATVIAARPELSMLFLAPLAVLGSAQRTRTALEVDRMRIEALQRATHHLSGDATPVEALPQVLESIRSAFEASAVTVVLADGATTTCGDESLSDLARVLAQKVVPSPSLRLSATDATEVAADLAAAGRRCALLARLSVEGRWFGTLVSIDRGGADGFDDGELAVFDAVAAEIASALARGELHTTLARERARLFEIIDRSSDGIFTVTGDGKVDEWNPAMAALTGFESPADGGGHVAALLRAHTSDGDDAMLERWSETGIEALPTEVRVVTRDRETRTLACSYSETASEPRSLVVIARDVTRQRELDELRDGFVATVSHELRTPLTSILGFSTMLAGSPRPLSDAQREQAVTMIRKGARRLERLIYNLLEVARIEQRRTPSALAPVDVASACETVVAELHDLYPTRDVEVVLPRLASTAIGNQLSVEQILTNLISNAMKYSADETIRVTVTESSGALTIAVSDAGPGIPPSEREAIFDRFHRVDQNHVQAGTGLGLYIARQLAVAMNGTLTVESEVGVGTTFSLRLPAEARLVAVS